MGERSQRSTQMSMNVPFQQAKGCQQTPYVPTSITYVTIHKMWCPFQPVYAQRCSTEVPKSIYINRQTNIHKR